MTSHWLIRCDPAPGAAPSRRASALAMLPARLLEAEVELSSAVMLGSSAYLVLWFFVIYSVLGVVLTLVSTVVTLAALARIRRRIAALHAQFRGEAAIGWDRLIDRLVPEPVMINTFPRMSLATELMELTGQRRAWLR